jgi:1,4-dihydroxy-2-naphthoyl-CoA hydrolase
MGFGVRGPGGNRTGSVVAVTMSSTPRSGTAKVAVPALHNIGSHRVPLPVPRKLQRPLGPCRHRGVQPTPGSAVPPDFEAPFDNELGLVFTELSPDRARAQLDVQPKLLQPMGIVHGGVYCSMVESLASTAAYTWLNANGGGSVVGVNNNTDFLRAIGSGTVFGTATPVHRGRRQQLWLVTITDSGDRLVARGQVRLQNLEAEN